MNINFYLVEIGEMVFFLVRNKVVNFDYVFDYMDIGCYGEF